MPALLRHEGVWRGVYRHLTADGALEDRHDAEVRCEFPRSGPYPYIQHNLFRWPDGRETRARLPAVFRDGRLWWDNDAFAGSAWDAGDGLIALNLQRKDMPGVRFFEIICLGADGRSRARTWHWFRGDQLIRRTLCDERRVD